MLESYRLAYLQTLGVKQYTPMFGIPFAKPSPELIYNQIYPEIEAQPIAPEALLPRSKVAETIEPTALVEGNVAESVNYDLQSKAKNHVKFALAMVDIPGVLLVLIDLTDADAMGCSGIEYQLLKAVFRSVGIDGEPSTYLFKWPMVNNPSAVQGETEAAEGLEGFLMAKQERNFAPSMLLIGRFASCFTINGQYSIKEFPGLTDVACYSIPALSDMLTSWESKADAWQVLSLLRTKLAQ